MFDVSKFNFSSLVSPALVIIILTLLLLYFRQIYSFWDKQGVPGPRPIWGFGNILSRLRAQVSMAEFDQMLYRDHDGKRFCGFFEFTQPTLMIGDPEILKHIMMKDFDHFVDRSFVVFNEPVMDHMLLGLKGTLWKAVRASMTPTFSSGKIKQTIGLVKDCSKNLVAYFDKELKTRSSFEMKEVFGMFTMDTIASIAFGVNSNSLVCAEDEFTAAAARFFSPPPAWRRPLVFMQMLLPRLTQLMRFNFLDTRPIKFFAQVVMDTIKYRMENDVRRNDFLQLLLDARLQELTNNNQLNGNVGTERKLSNEVLSELVITAQCVLFYIAGYDTTATTLSFLSYCLALNPQVQEHLVEEVEGVLEDHGGEVTYEALGEMKYLDMVIAETLRLYPPAPRVDRNCTKEYCLPGTDIMVKQGQKVIIPIYSIHHDADFWLDPEKFDPERFAEDTKVMHRQMLYLPFGSGPRNCIGKRFALMETKLAMVSILREFAFLPSRRTQVPLTIEKTSGLLKAEGGVWVRMTRRLYDVENREE